MSDISIRIPITPARLKFIEDKCVAKELLPSIKDTMYKPIGVNLQSYNPNDIYLRLRQFSDTEATLTEIKIIKTSTGYSDEKVSYGQGSVIDLENTATKLNFEVWGRMSTVSFEYALTIEDEVATVLHQKIDPIGEFLKIESPSITALDSLLVSLNVSFGDRIDRNAVVLLAEKLKLI